MKHVEAEKSFETLALHRWPDGVVVDLSVSLNPEIPGGFALHVQVSTQHEKTDVLNLYRPLREGGLVFLEAVAEDMATRASGGGRRRPPAIALADDDDGEPEQPEWRRLALARIASRHPVNPGAKFLAWQMVAWVEADGIDAPAVRAFGGGLILTFRRGDRKGEITCIDRHQYVIAPWSPQLHTGAARFDARGRPPVQVVRGLVDWVYDRPAHLAIAS